MQYRIKELPNDYDDMDMELKSLFSNLRKKPTAENLDLILSKNELQNVFGKVLNSSHGTKSKMTVFSLRDVSALIAIVSAAREKKLKWLLQAGREMIKYCFTFDHIKYSGI